MPIGESAENYPETIFILSKKLPNVRSFDIAAEDACKMEDIICNESFEAVFFHRAMCGTGFISTPFVIK